MKLIRISLWSIALAMTAGACVQTFPEWNRGRDFSVVVNVESKPFRGMRVLLQPKDEQKKSDQVETISDENGIARFHGVKPGEYYVEATRLGVEVGPGTVIVSDHGSSDPIEVQWPLRPSYTVVSVAGRFQRYIFRKKKSLVEQWLHPTVGPVAGATLTLGRVESEKEIKVVETDAIGDFDFGPLEPGSYLLHIAEKPSSEFAYEIDDYMLIYVDPTSPRKDLSLQIDWSSCGMTARDITSSPKGDI